MQTALLRRWLRNHLARDAFMSRISPELQQSLCDVLTRRKAKVGEFGESTMAFKERCDRRLLAPNIFPSFLDNMTLFTPLSRIFASTSVFMYLHTDAPNYVQSWTSFAFIRRNFNLPENIVSKYRVMFNRTSQPKSVQHPSEESKGAIYRGSKTWILIYGMCFRIWILSWWCCFVGTSLAPLMMFKYVKLKLERFSWTLNPPFHLTWWVLTISSDTLSKLRS